MPNGGASSVTMESKKKRLARVSDQIARDVGGAELDRDVLLARQRLLHHQVVGHVLGLHLDDPALTAKARIEVGIDQLLSRAEPLDGAVFVGALDTLVPEQLPVPL